MLRPVTATIAVALLCSGCANATLTPTLGSGNVLTGGSTSGVGLATEANASEAPRKTIASKVLAAIALERVTGRKPDPARFRELD